MMLSRRMISKDKVRGTLPIILGNMAGFSSASLQDCLLLWKQQNICQEEELSRNDREVVLFYCRSGPVSAWLPQSLPSLPGRTGSSWWWLRSVFYGTHGLLPSLLTTGKDNLCVPPLTCYHHIKWEILFYVQTDLFMNYQTITFDVILFNSITITKLCYYARKVFSCCP